MAYQDRNGAWHSNNIDDSQIIQQESSGNPWAMNTKTGAAGLMQLMPQTANNPGFGIAPVKDNGPMENRRVGTQYLDALYDYYHGDVDKALAAYNWGMGNVDNAVKNNGEAWRTVLPDETRHYINNYHRGEGMNTSIPELETGNAIKDNYQASTTSFYTTPNGQDTTIPPVPVGSHFPTLAEIQAKYNTQNKVLLDDPSTMQQLEHLGETLLKTVGVAALAGFTGGIPLAIGLSACIKTHDKDKAYIKRRPEAEEMLKAGYSPAAVRKWAETGDDKALVEDEKQRYTEFASERQYDYNVNKDNLAQQNNVRDYGEKVREFNESDATTRRGQDLSAQSKLFKSDGGNVTNFAVKDADTNKDGVLSPSEQQHWIVNHDQNPLTGTKATGAELNSARKYATTEQLWTTQQGNLNRGQAAVKELMNNPNFKKAIGPIDNLYPDFMVGSDVQSVRNQVAKIKSQEFLNAIQAMKGMGSLSNAEGEKLQDAIAHLDMSQHPEAVMSQLRNIDSMYDQLKATAEQDAEMNGYNPAPAQAGLMAGKAPTPVKSAKNSDGTVPSDGTVSPDGHLVVYDGNVYYNTPAVNAYFKGK
ncbi:lytic transglycosylase domain-containing protein [Citrobacter freundii]|uniref:lytic transglycosylase domain-containing protein n=2 Tax=Citrobacter portucalensis TaxID=1639133 RepID=UPI0015E90541|nr:lytic transglycosylase domain-containing protein [Citrobacter freundii]